MRTARVSIGIAALGLAMVGAATTGAAQAVREPLAPFRQEIPKAAFAIDMVPVAGEPAKGIKPFWISRTEVPWEAFDVFMYGLDETPEPDSGSGAGEPGTRADAVSRPSKPYLPPDRGFGHDGFAAIAMSHTCAAEYCKWLSVRSGRKFRLATEDEWEHACGPAPASLPDAAWSAENSGGKPQPVGRKAPNALGLHDMLGNVAEWVDGRDGRPVVKGGSYRDPADRLTPAWREPASRAWNASDPQIPKSRWWLADAPFVGFRIVCEPAVENEPGKGTHP